MTRYLLSALVAAGLSSFFTSQLIRYAKGHRLFMPALRERDIHHSPTPRVGGIAVVVSFLLVVLFWQVHQPAVWNFTGNILLGFDKNLLGVLLGVALLTVINVIDDRQPIAWQARLVVQIIAALLVVGFGIKIQWLSNPFGPRWVLGTWEWFIVAVWLVGLTNVVNWLDGIDGLVSGVSAIALAVLFFLSISPAVAQSQNALLAAIVFGAVIGFLPFNLRPGGARAFLGDTGSMFLGFMIGIIAIISGGKIATAFLVLSIPFIDAAIVLFSRLAHRQSPFMADKRHLHHRLLEAGLSRAQIVGLFYFISLAFGLIALNTQTLGKMGAALAALGLMVVLILFYRRAIKRRTLQNESRI